MVLKVQHTYQNGRLKKVKPTYQKIGVVYESGEMTTVGSTDVWVVRKSKDSKADFETVK